MAFDLTFSFQKTIFNCCFFAVLWCLIGHLDVTAQTKIKGNVQDRSSNEGLLGAHVIIKGTTEGGVTDMDGNFEFTTNRPLPVTVITHFVGYISQEQEVTSPGQKLRFKLITKDYRIKGIEVTEERISNKEKEHPLTVESMDVIAIRETPASNFYEGLGTLKGVDLTSASIGFKVINTRGFNSTSPVRSLQLIDGVDNQAPGLNFSLGNFLGASEIDVMKVDLIQGASSAFYGPNAFNGVISMTTKDPFLFPGLTVYAKAAERNLRVGSVRWAKVWQKNNIDKLGFKFNFFYLEADDWEAENYAAVYESESSETNWGGYDAVNRYGDEEPIYFNSKNLQINQPGLGVIHRNGYAEKDIVDYGTQNIKANAALHYKLDSLKQLIVASNFGNGTTVYQGDNRYSLKDILFFQNRVELKGKNGFIRAYATHEDAGRSYDAVFTALLLQDRAKSNAAWAADYFYYWNTYHKSNVQNLPDFPSVTIDPGPPPVVVYNFELAESIMLDHSDLLSTWHQMARDSANLGTSPPQGISFNNNIDFLIPGTEAFQMHFDSIVNGLSFSEGGSRFFDKSALYHIQGEQHFHPVLNDSTTLDITIGGNYRIYTPNSKGTIFSDTAGRITNQEAGVYFGLSKWLIANTLKVSGTLRVDKNQNFPFVSSPALSAIYRLNESNVLRFSFSSAIRNPTLADQYLHYNVGRAILLGNITGYDSLVTVASARALASSQNADTLEYFNISPIVPEKVKSFEVGYRTTLFERLYIDAGYYFSIYKDFIGYNIGVDATIDPTTNLFNPGKTRVVRVAANADDMVTTMGVSVGANYYFKKFFTAHANYSWNRLDMRGSDDPIIPAFNTPEHKYNIGFSGREVDTYIKLSKKENARMIGIHNFGFGINYKWVQGFLYEGSPQFTGWVPAYDMLDVQINQYIPNIKTTIKIGASNVLNNLRFQVYGGPRIGRMAYISLLFEPDRKH